METVLSVMSFTGGMVIGFVFGVVVTIVFISIAVGLKNDFNNFHARLLPKAKPIRVRKAEIYKAVGKTLKKQKSTWTLKFNVCGDRSLNTPVDTIGEDFFYIRTNEVKVVHQDLVRDLRRRGYEVKNVLYKNVGVDAIDVKEDIESITLTVKVE